MSEKEFYSELEGLGIVLQEKQKEQFEKFYSFLKEKNQVMNLTRIVEKEEVYLKHFYDSSTLLKIIDLNEVKTLCDVGSGAGFPGVVLKILYPHLEIVLLDALQKRVNYLNELIDFLELENIKAYHQRGEEYKEKKFDVVTARAVASLEKLLPICMPLVNEKGCFIAMKANVEEEKEKAKSLFTKKGIQLVKEEKFYLPQEGSLRTLLCYKKEQKEKA